MRKLIKFVFTVMSTLPGCIGFGRLVKQGMNNIDFKMEFQK